MKVRLIAATAGALLVASALGSPAANAEETEVTFSISSSGTVALEVVTALGDLSDPVSSPLGATSSGQIASVRVTDPTADLTGWSVSAAMADPFTSTTDLGAAGIADDTIPCTAATLTSAAATATTGTVVFTPALVNTALTLDDSTAGDADDCAAKSLGSAVTVGANTATFPTNISIAVPSTALAGTYQGTIVQTAV